MSRTPECQWCWFKSFGSINSNQNTVVRGCKCFGGFK